MGILSFYLRQLSEPSLLRSVGLGEIILNPSPLNKHSSYQHDKN